MGDKNYCCNNDRASAIGVKGELPPVLWVQLKAVYSETNYLHCEALQLASLRTISLQAGKIEILFQLS